MEFRSSRSYGLDFLKILATIAIVFHHFQQDFGITYTNHINFYGTWFYWGYMVELFFILSGYFMVKYIPFIQSGKITFGGWIERRSKRLLPMVAISAICYELLYVLHWVLKGEYWAWGRAPTLWGVVVTGLGLQAGGAFANPHVNNVTWYISVLLICYWLFYVLTKLAKKASCSESWLYAIMVLLGVSVITYGTDLAYLNTLAARGYRSFFYGVLLAQFINRYGITRKEVFSCTVIIIVLTLFFVFKPGYVSLDLCNVLSFLMFPAIIILFESDLAKRIFCHKFWGIWSQISYNVYIWHVVGYFAMDIAFGLISFSPDYSDIRYMYLYIIAIEIFGMISFYFIEKPLNRWVDRIFADFKLRDRHIT